MIQEHPRDITASVVALALFSLWGTAYLETCAWRGAKHIMGCWCLQTLWIGQNKKL